jgi:hypothetical protein
LLRRQDMKKTERCRNWHDSKQSYWIVHCKQPYFTIYFPKQRDIIVFNSDDRHLSSRIAPHFKGMWHKLPINDVILRCTYFLIIKLQLINAGRALIAGIIREWIMPFVSSHWRVLKNDDPDCFGATCNFNDQILPYGILCLTSINTNVFYLMSFKFSRKLVKTMAFFFEEQNQYRYKRKHTYYVNDSKVIHI